MRAALASWSTRAARATRPLWWTRPVLFAPAATAWFRAPISLHVAAGWLALLWGAWHRHALSWQVTTRGWGVWRWHPATGSRGRFVIMGALLHAALLAGLCSVPWRLAGPSGLARGMTLAALLSVSLLLVEAAVSWARLARRGLRESASDTVAWARRRFRRAG